MTKKNSSLSAHLAKICAYPAHPATDEAFGRQARKTRANKPHVVLSLTTVWARKGGCASARAERSDLGQRGCRRAKSALFSRHASPAHIFHWLTSANSLFALRALIHSVDPTCPPLIVDKCRAFKLPCFSSGFVFFISPVCRLGSSRVALLQLDFRPTGWAYFQPRGNRKFMFINSDHPAPPTSPGSYK